MRRRLCGDGRSGTGPAARPVVAHGYDDASLSSSPGPATTLHRLLLPSVSRSCAPRQCAVSLSSVPARRRRPRRGHERKPSAGGRRARENRRGRDGRAGGRATGPQPKPRKEITEKTSAAAEVYRSGGPASHLAEEHPHEKLPELPPHLSRRAWRESRRKSIGSSRPFLERRPPRVLSDVDLFLRGKPGADASLRPVGPPDLRLGRVERPRQVLGQRARSRGSHAGRTRGSVRSRGPTWLLLRESLRGLDLRLAEVCHEPLGQGSLLVHASARRGRGRAPVADEQDAAE